MVGSALVRALHSRGYQNLLLRTSRELDLRNQAAVQAFFRDEQPDYVFLAAARVGGIHANNTFRGAFLYDNLAIATNVIHAAYIYGAEKLLFLGSSCIYPRMAPQPIREEYLLTGALEPTNEPYAIAKIAGLKLCEAYRQQYGFNAISVMPTNLYGPGDNYHPEHAHVLPALLRRFHEAREQGLPAVQVWGSGSPRREFLYADDLADACIFLMQQYEGHTPVNIGTGQDISIAALAQLIKKVTGYTGAVVFDQDRPDGTPRKLLDVSKLHGLGWQHQTPLTEGLQRAYADFLQGGARHKLPEVNPAEMIY